MNKITLLLFLFALTNLSAQRFNILSGKLSDLKGISEYNVTFDYSNQEVNGFESEEAFLNEKTDKRKNTVASADNFKKDWFEDRENKYEPKFIESFNKRFKTGEIKVAKNAESKYTIIIKSTWVYPGYNVVIGSEPAKLSAMLTVVETLNQNKSLLIIEFDKVIGLEQGQFDFDQGYRIAGAYEKLAKNFAIQLKRFL